MKRVRQQLLDVRLEWLNKALGRPMNPWRTENGKNKGNIGNLHFDKNIGGLRIEEIANESGAASCPFGCNRWSTGEMYEVLDTILAAVEMAQKGFTGAGGLTGNPHEH